MAQAKTLTPTELRRVLDYVDRRAGNGVRWLNVG
jgi:hypothetical protein